MALKFSDDSGSPSPPTHAQGDSEEVADGLSSPPNSVPGTIATDSRARELTAEQHTEARQATERRQRVELCHDWMVRGWYRKGRTDKALAALWGVARSTVWGYSSEAAGILRRELTGKSRDDLLAELLVRIQAIGDDALERREEMALQSGEVVEVRRPDHRTALRAAEATGELLGLKIQRHHHTVTAGEMTTEQILEQLSAHGVRVEMPRLTEGEEVRDGDEKKSGSGEPVGG